MQPDSHSSSIRIIQHPEFNILEFRNRWKKSRISALNSTLVGSKSSFSKIQNEQDEQDEMFLLKRITNENREAALKNVFDHSRRLGLSVAKFFGVTWEMSDFSEVLPQLDLPCFATPWKKHNEAQVLERNGCASLIQSGSLGCDYWREALDGLVMGVGENERLARHRSQGHGDSNCVDILFTENYVFPKIVSAHTQNTPVKTNVKFGPLPDEILEKLIPVQKRFAGMKVCLTLDGFSEGTLYYQLHTDEGVLCGAGGKLMHDSFLREFSKHFPSLATKDVSPLAVYGGSS